ncbi:MAG: rod shape-determining protein MreC [Endomicrobium sp.]|jgi:rod shape-determining protein MreC|nr:rod shape-determining protein MreC [Endomicrobium sp.]
MYRRRKLRSGDVIFIVLVFISFSFVICRVTYPLKIIKTLVYRVTYQNLNLTSRAFRLVHIFTDIVKSTIHMYHDNVAYKQKNQELINNLNNYIEMSKEYNDLLSFLKLGKIRNVKSVFAEISVIEPNGWYRCFIINKGKSDGLYNELPVLVFNSKNNTLYPVGKIIETYDTSSKVVMITNSIHTLPVEIKTSGINCLAEGCNSNLLKIKYIPCSADVKLGDEIIVSRLSTIFQKGIPVGTVINITDSKFMDFKTAVAEVYFEKIAFFRVIVFVPHTEK